MTWTESVRRLLLSHHRRSVQHGELRAVRRGTGPGRMAARQRQHAGAEGIRRRQGGKAGGGFRHQPAGQQRQQLQPAVFGRGAVAFHARLCGLHHAAGLLGLQLYAAEWFGPVRVREYRGRMAGHAPGRFGFAGIRASAYTVSARGTAPPQRAGNGPAATIWPIWRARFPCAAQTATRCTVMPACTAAANMRH